MQQKPALKDLVYNQERRSGFMLLAVHTDSVNILIILFLERTETAQSLLQVRATKKHLGGLKVNPFEQKILNSSRITSIPENCLDTLPSFEW